MVTAVAVIDPDANSSTKSSGSESVTLMSLALSIECRAPNIFLGMLEGNCGMSGHAWLMLPSLYSCASRAISCHGLANLFLALVRIVRTLRDFLSGVKDVQEHKDTCRSRLTKQTVEPCGSEFEGIYNKSLVHDPKASSLSKSSAMNAVIGTRM